MNTRLYFRITLTECNGQVIASWPYDAAFPVTAPRFTYPNLNAQSPYQIRFDGELIWQRSILAGIDINDAIEKAVREFVAEIGG